MNMEGRTMKHKVGAAVASARRGGALQAVDTMRNPDQSMTFLLKSTK